MAEIVLFHSALGLRPGVFAAADRLREAGHLVHTPDLYGGGTVFDDYAEASAHVETLGYAELMARSLAAVAGLPGGLVYAGFSNGGASAELLAGTRPGARAAVLLHAALPPELLGIPEWPGTVPVQVHYAERDPFRTQDWIDGLAAAVAASGARYEFVEYPGSGHLFADPDLAGEYDPASSERMYGEVLAFLAGLDQLPGRRGCRT